MLNRLESMQSLRGNLASLPNALSHLISTATSPVEGTNCLPPNLTSPSFDSDTVASVSGDDSSDKSHAIPNSLIKEQWQLVLEEDATIDELTTAIEKCKELVLKTDECSTERKWLVRHLVELRFRLREMEDANVDHSKTWASYRIILGHHFVDHHNQKPSQTTVRPHCDHCTGIIWSVVQASYICIDCNFRVHYKCIESIVRVCAHVITSERKEPLDDICPETGLSFQAYKCAECNTSLSFKGGWVEPRICDYTGLYYCPTCHWNDTAAIPARILHNWDFTPYKVCRATLQEMTLTMDRPVIDLEEKNSKLFIYVQNLSLVKKLRTNLNDMRRYLTECRIATNGKILENAIGARRHLVQCTNMYSIADLIGVENGTIIEFLNKTFATFEQHIRKCELCSGKGYLCEICSNVEVLFPFDDGAIHCKKCKTVFHRACWLRKNQKCPKCTRMEYRRSLLQQSEEDEANANKSPPISTNT
ncbi:differentially expressed in FDCP 8 homolog isoform X2 [Sitodiplosis mosellana]|uniref:differentially expressed in FDCP 8 homolog isoform X2 n=1 Tax=Sitodiplosis mosellana TaxID=263140 RepID=UPI002443DB0E|nr:differentially expressed in FDCP 8 homolog isoform X2 [Sitodiplosis mosellana]